MSFLNGIGSLFSKVTNHIQDREERRRNEIDKLEKRQKFIERNRRNDLAGEYERNHLRLDELYQNAKNA